MYRIEFLKKIYEEIVAEYETGGEVKDFLDILCAMTLAKCTGEHLVLALVAAEQHHERVKTILMNRLGDGVQ
jgi:hypothetical protein